MTTFLDDYKIRIKEDDFVNIYWDGTLDPECNLKVLYIPTATGDCWHLLREDGTVIYVMFFMLMEKCK